MIKNVLKNLFSPPATRPFPRERRPAAANVRGTVEFTNEGCTYCSACALKCPTDAITVDRTAKTLDFDVFRCIACNCCVEACKKGCVQMSAAYRGPVYDRPLLHHEAAPVVEAIEASEPEAEAPAATQT